MGAKTVVRRKRPFSGGTEVRGWALSPHGKKILSLNPLGGMFACSSYTSGYNGFLPQSKDVQVRLT